MRVLLADDSPHAQRMGERILREEGFDVVSVTDGETAVLRLADVAPDVIIADIFLPKRSGYDLCRLVKTNPRYSHTRVILAAGLLEPFDEDQARSVHYDGVLKKPFEASAMMAAVKPAASAPVQAASGTGVVREQAPAAPGSKERRSLGLRGLFDRKPTVIRVIPEIDTEAARSPAEQPEPAPPPRPQLVAKPPAPVETPVRPAAPKPPAPVPLPGDGPESAIERYARQFLSKSAGPSPSPEPDAEAVRAAVTLALDAAMPAMVEEISRRVLAALESSRNC